MAVGDTVIGTGTTIAFGASITLTAEILNVRWTGAGDIAVIDKSHMGSTTWKEKLLANLADPGAIELDVHFKGGETPPLADQATVTISFPDGSTLASTMGVKDFEMDDPLEDKMTASYTLECLGAVTLA